MKRLIAKVLLLTSGLIMAVHTQALGLGEMTLTSALNQPLRASIDLVDVGNLTALEIRPKLASSKDFQRAGIERLHFLTKIKFTLQGDRLVLTTREPVTEPFLNFLLELSWPSGRVLREFTALLDPPTYQADAQPATVSAPSSAPTKTASTSAKRKTKPTQARSQNNTDRTLPKVKKGQYRVKSNDTLWKVAVATLPSNNVTPQQMMIALQKANMRAFSGKNINRLQSQRVLRVPTEDEVRQVSHQQALAEVKHQSKGLPATFAQIDATGRANSGRVSAKGTGTGGEVRLLSDADAAATEDGTGSNGENGQDGSGNSDATGADGTAPKDAELRDRLASLEEQIKTLQSLVALKDDQLASLQAGSAQANAEQEAQADVENADDVVADANASDADVLNTDAANSDDVANGDDVAQNTGDTSDNALAEAEQTGNVPSDAISVEGGEDNDAEAAEREARQARIAALLESERRKQEAEKADDPMAALLEKPEYLAGGAAALLLLIAALVFAVKRRRKDDEHDDVIDEPTPSFAESSVEESDLNDLDLPDMDDLNDHDTSSGYEGGGLPAVDESTPEAAEKESTASVEDILSEVDIYIAYGKFEQAASVLNKAIEANPERSDLMLKMLEVHQEMDNAESFANIENKIIALNDSEAIDKAEQMRQRLSAPIEPDQRPELNAESTLDDMSNALGLGDNDDDGNLNEEFEESIDFGDALDLDDSDAIESADDFAASLKPLASTPESLDLNDDEAPAELDDVPNIGLNSDDDNNIVDFDPELDLAVMDTDEDDEVEQERNEAGNAIEFDLGDVELDAAVSEQDTAEQEEGVEFELDDLTSDNDDVISLDLDDGLELNEPELSESESEESELAEPKLEEAELEEPELEESELEEAELEEPEQAETILEEPEAVESDESQPNDDDVDLSADLAALDSELDDLESGVDFDADPEVDDGIELAPANVAADESEHSNDDVELGVTEEETDIDESATAQHEGSDIDLDALVASDDEFDFLSGTDENATKLDLARAYVDMEDAEGARELLNEVLKDGSDEQKAEATALLDKLG